MQRASRHGSCFRTGRCGSLQVRQNREVRYISRLRITLAALIDGRQSMEFIRIRGARTHNLKNVNLDLPRDKLVVITGLIILYDVYVLFAKYKLLLLVAWPQYLNPAFLAKLDFSSEELVLRWA